PVFALLDRGAKVSERFRRNQESRLHWPAQILLGQFDFLSAERGAVRFRRVLFVRAAVTDMSAYSNERRPPGFGARARQRSGDGSEIIAGVDVLDVPAVGFKAPSHIL